MSEPICDFFVPDTPRSGGSKKGFVNPKTGRVIVTESSASKNKEWRASVCHFAYHAYHGKPLDESGADFEMAKSNFDSFDLKAHPKQGNIVTLVKSI